MRASLLTTAIVCCGLSGCLGYHVGPAKPNYLRDVHTLAVPTFKNRTLVPRIEVLVTDTVIKQLQQDGTFKVASDGNGDATLEADIVQVDRTPARSVRGNVLATTEFSLTLRVRYHVVGRDGTMLVSATTATGRTSFFVGGDVVTDERQALPLATENLATQLVSQLSEGW